MVLPSNALTLGLNLGLECDKVTHISPQLSQTLHESHVYQSPNVIKMINIFNNQQDIETELTVHHIPIFLWSDGCDTNGTSKGNSSSIKLITIHILHMPLMTNQHVFFVEVVKKKTNHHPIWKLMLEDIIFFI